MTKPVTHARSYPTYIITQEPGMVPRRKGPFYGNKMVENFLREAYRYNPDIICIVIDMETADNTWHPDHGYEWLDINGDRRKRHPRTDRPRANPPPAQILGISKPAPGAKLVKTPTSSGHPVYGKCQGNNQQRDNAESHCAFYDAPIATQTINVHVLAHDVASQGYFALTQGRCRIPSPSEKEVPAETVFDVASAEACEPALREPAVDQCEVICSASDDGETFVNCRRLGAVVPSIRAVIDE